MPACDVLHHQIDQARLVLIVGVPFHGDVAAFLQEQFVQALEIAAIVQMALVPDDAQPERLSHGVRVIAAAIVADDDVGLEMIRNRGERLRDRPLRVIGEHQDDGSHGAPKYARMLSTEDAAHDITGTFTYLTGIALVHGEGVPAAPVTLAISRTPLGRVVIGCALAYTVWHFIASGVRFPLQAPNIAQIEEEIAPLTAYLETGVPPESRNVRQYGPVFFLVLQPFLLASGGDRTALANWLYGLQLVATALAFLCCVLSLRLWLDQENGAAEPRLPTPHLALLLGLLWFNFSPLYAIVAGKNVETWELALITLALYAYLRGLRFWAVFCIAAATLIKMLPIAFFVYFLIRDRRALAYAAVSFVVLLTAAQILYWPQMGYGYLPLMVNAAVGQTHALGWHENIGLKNMVVKALAGWQIASGTYFVTIDEQRMFVANVLGHVMQVVGGLWLLWALTKFRGPTSARPHPLDAIWGWSMISVVMLILSPVTAFEYMVLSLVAFSFALTYLAAERSARTDVAGWTLFGGATLLVGNIVPRQVVNVLFPIAALNRLTGSTHLTLSEGYQHYGFPLVGLFLLLAALWRMRPQPVASQAA